MIDAVALRLGAAHPRVDDRRLRPARHRAQPRGQPAGQLGAARQLPDRRRALRVRGGRLRRKLRPAVPGHGSPRPRSTTPASPPWPTAPATATRSTASWPHWTRGPHARPRSSAACVAHDVPVATAYSARGHRRRPAHGGARRPGRGRRPGARPGAPAGALPAAGRRDRRRCRRARRRSGADNDEVWCDMVGLDATSELEELGRQGGRMRALVFGAAAGDRRGPARAGRRPRAHAPGPALRPPRGGRRPARCGPTGW